MKHRLLITLPTLSLALLASAAPAHAQFSRFDKTTLIEGLRKEGMGELLKHLALTELSDGKDPVLAKQVLINQYLIDYAQKRAAALKEQDGARAVALRKEALDAFNGAQAARLALVKELPDNEQRPLWQTDNAEQQIFEYLQIIKDNANDFYEFGVPSAEQRTAYETVVPEVLAATADADVRLFVLQGDLPKEKDHTEKRVNTGLWDRMMNQYYKTRTQYFLAHAAFYAAQLPDSHAYYRVPNPKIIQQRKTAAEERSRLLSLTVERLEGFIKDLNDPYEVRRPAQALSARAQLALGRVDEALASLDAVIKANAADRTDLVARIARASALEAKGQGPAALAQLADLHSHAMVKDNLLFRLLIVDSTHRLLLRRADKAQGKEKASLVALAYEPYQQFLDDPSLGESAESIKDYIYRRWEANTTATTPAEFVALPGAVAAAIAEINRSKGQALMEQAAGEADAKKAGAMRTDGSAKLQKTIDICTGLLKRDDLRPSVRAQTKFNLAISYYFLDPKDNQKLLKCAGILTELGAELPDQKISEAGIINAVSMLRYLHEQPKRMSGVDQAYERAAVVLLTNYPTTPAAINERFYVGAAVFEATGRFAKAAEILAAVPSDNADYYPAQQEMLHCLHVLYRQARGLSPVVAEPETQPATTQAASAPAAAPAPAAGGKAEDARKLAEKVVVEATRIREEAARFLQQASAEQAPAARRAAGSATLVLADMAVDEEKKYEKVLTLLKDFDRDYGAEAELMRPMLEKRIIALFQVNQFDEAVNESMRMMNGFPDDAAPVVDRVLTGLDAIMEQLRRSAGGELVESRKKAMLDRADAISKVELKLADLLYKWAVDQKYPEDKMLPFKLVFAKSLRLSGDPKKALEMLQPLLAKAKDNADLLHNVAECYFAIGGEKSLTDNAAPLYDRLIRDLPPEEGGKYPAIWWNAWMRRLQISEITKTGLEQVSLNVRALQNTDPNLGGEATKLELVRLRNKFAGTVAKPQQ
ncbi:MAG: hypothetical protein NTW19_06425 [Planctomycetota bacterium]|nr:hypothetical protein [Planctomycetota bacterium]